jgi:DNA (cytosine-5)-methyltransferase 1
MIFTHIDLFSGIGGFALAARWAGFKTLCFVEIDEYCGKIIEKNFGAVPVAHAVRCDGRQNYEGEVEAGRNRTAPLLFRDIRDFDGTIYRGATLLSGGFPCQPFSQAGKRRGSLDDRALWPEMYRVIRESQPTWVLAENVAGLVAMELDTVLSDLESEGYSVQSFIIPACAVDARHRRDRVWIVANSLRAGGQQIARGAHGDESENEGRAAKYDNEPSGNGEAVADSPDNGCERTQRAISENRHTSRRLNASDCREWQPEPDVLRVAVRLPRGMDGYHYEDEWEGVPRVATGVKNRVQRLKGLGNSIQPQVAYEILRVIAEIENHVASPNYSA